MIANTESTCITKIHFFFFDIKNSDFQNYGERNYMLHLPGLPLPLCSVSTLTRTWACPLQQAYATDTSKINLMNPTQAFFDDIPYDFDHALTFMHGHGGGAVTNFLPEWAVIMSENGVFEVTVAWALLSFFLISWSFSFDSNDHFNPPK